MARYAIISDIQGNLKALKAVLNAISKEDVEAIYNLGDIVGFESEPQKCIKALSTYNKDTKILVYSVRGDQDYALTKDDPSLPKEIEAPEWIRSVFSPKELKSLDNLEDCINKKNVGVFAHATFSDNPLETMGIYDVDGYTKAAQFLVKHKQTFGFLGHTDKPGGSIIDPDDCTCKGEVLGSIFYNEEENALIYNRKNDGNLVFIINPGPVDDVLAHYAIFERFCGVDKVYFRAVPISPKKQTLQ